MLFIKNSLVALALAVSALATPIFTTPQPLAVTAGTTASWAYSGATGPVTITLKTGSSSNLGTVMVFPGTSSSGTFTWSIPASAINGQYALEISDGNGPPNYSAQFQLSGGQSGTIPTIATTGGATLTATSSGSSRTGSTTSNLLTSISLTSSASISASTTITSTRNSTLTRTSTSTTSTSTSVSNLNAGAMATAGPLAVAIPAFMALFAL